MPWADVEADHPFEAAHILLNGHAKLKKERKKVMKKSEDVFNSNKILKILK